jgi:aryl-alcohol dehydrogenase-like predicted oxidoreductase
LAGNPPSPHTLKTPFFPLALYERDGRRAAKVRDMLPAKRSLSREAIRFALAHPQIDSAIIGFGSIPEIDAAIGALMADDPAIDYEKVLSVVECRF